jgi:hypothetical protein
MKKEHTPKKERTTGNKTDTKNGTTNGRAMKK